MDPSLPTVLHPPLVAYLGPGAVVSSLGAFLALLAGIVVALFGFVWYPIRRLLRRKRSAPPPEGDAQG